MRLSFRARGSAPIGGDAESADLSSNRSLGGSKKSSMGNGSQRSSRSSESKESELEGKQSEGNDEDEGFAGREEKQDQGEGEKKTARNARAEEAKLVDDSDDEDTKPRQVQYKIILMGDGAVGKTSLATRFTQDHFKASYKQTIGLDFFIQRLVLPGDVQVAMQIWDIGGQSIGSRMIQNYIYGSDAVLLCYDITNYPSFQNLEDWLRLVKRSFVNKRLPYIALVANKTDLEHLRAVSQDKHDNFCDENNFFTYQVSAKSGHNVQTSFHRVAADLAGIVLSNPELEVSRQVVRADIVEHEQNAPLLQDEPRRSNSAKRCVLQ